jgi:alkanesulfonate monooxygenase SsuD/methylene tetrahydromethanopterin reductase-like flavin-dependent oxidoreductase (luciferase family)
VVLGVGAGWLRDEFDVLGAPFAGRGARMDEAIEIIRRLGRDGEITWRGDHYAFPRVFGRPIPKAPVPIYIGGASEAAQRRAARIGDGYLSMLFTVDELIRQHAHIDELRAEAGRSDLPFEFIAVATDAHAPEDFARMAAGGIDTAMIHVFDDLPGGMVAPVSAKIDAVYRSAEALVRTFA